MSLWRYHLDYHDAFDAACRYCNEGKSDVAPAKTFIKDSADVEVKHDAGRENRKAIRRKISVEGLMGMKPRELKTDLRAERREEWRKTYNRKLKCETLVLTQEEETEETE